MKKVYTLLSVMLVSTALFAQPSYYVLPTPDAGFNPGNLNGDAEQPNEPGWNQIMATTSTDMWSSAQSIPFTFQFNGTTQSSFVISNTGVLTFSPSPGTAPSATNLALPTTTIPDNSVCVWGLDLTGGNDNIRTKVFGTSPNRQMWIQFTSASAPELTGSSQWAYWSIVLEETTNNIYVVDQRTYDGNVSGGQPVPTGNNVSLTVGIQINSTNYVAAPSSPTTGSNTLANAGSGADATDNTFYEFVYGTQNNDDMAGIEADIPKIVEVNQGLFISGLFRNLGSNTLAAADFNYRVNGGNVVSTVSAGNLPVATGAYKTLSSSTQWTPSSDGKYEIEMWMSQLNGSADGDNSNDTIKLDVYATSNPPNRKVVIEERTGTWCQWCPRGTVSMEIMSRERHNSTVLIAVHNADPMALPAYDPNLSGGFPTFTGDRIFSEQSISSDASNMKKFDDERQKLVPEASVKITNLNYNSGTGALAVDMESEFVVDAPNSDYRYVVVLTEDGVTGTSGGYAQVNAYSGSSQLTLVGPDGRDYTQLPNPIPANQMVYDHVAIDIAPNFGGLSGSVPSNISQGQIVTHTINTTLPSSMQNENHVWVNVLLLDNNNEGVVVNANYKKLTNKVGLDENDKVVASVYPNPATDFFSVELEENTDFSLELINTVGQIVYRAAFTDSKDAVVNTADLAKGMYILNIRSGNGVSSTNVAVTR